MFITKRLLFSFQNWSFRHAVAYIRECINLMNMCSDRKNMILSQIFTINAVLNVITNQLMKNCNYCTATNPSHLFYKRCQNNKYLFWNALINVDVNKIIILKSVGHLSLYMFLGCHFTRQGSICDKIKMEIGILELIPDWQIQKPTDDFSETPVSSKYCT